MHRKSTLVLAAGLVLGGSGLIVPSPVNAARTAAVKQSVEVVSVSDHCVDEFDEELIIYVNEGDKDCKVSVRVKGRGTTKSKVVLEYLDEEEGWTRDTDNKTRVTSTAGRTFFLIGADFPTEPGSTCYTGDSWSYRIAVSSSGRYRAFRSDTFQVVYTSADDNPACTSDGSEGDDSDW